MISLATTYEGNDRELLRRVLPLVDFIETTPDSLAALRGGRPTMPERALAELEEIVATKRLLVHGVGLSIGSHDAWNDDYLRLLDAIFGRADVAWHSEHLACSRVDGRDLGTMLVMPRTEEALDVVCQRVLRIRAMYGLPFLLENVINLLPEMPRPEYTHAAFLNEIVRRTGCGLLLDVYNLQCDAANHGLDIDAFLGELDLGAVREVHIAGGVKYRGMQLDVHSRRTQPETVQLAQHVLSRAANAEVLTYELLPQAVRWVGYDAIVEELTMLRAMLREEVAA